MLVLCNGIPGLWCVVDTLHTCVHFWIDFSAIVFGPTDNVSAEECNARLPTKQEWVYFLEETDPVFHNWQYNLLIQHLTVGPITSTVKIMRYLQLCEVAQTVQLLQDGSSVRLVARRFGLSPCAISRARRRFGETGQNFRRAGQGRRRATTHHQDRYFVLSARRFRQSTARSLQSDLQCGIGVQISDQTVRNRLHSSKLRSQCSFVGLILTRRHRVARRAFAREHQSWQVRHWRPVLFSDESRFNLSGSYGRVGVWRSTGECYHACNIVQHNRFGGGSVVVWGGISLEGRTDMHVLNRGNLTGARYRDEILRPIVRPYADAVGPGFLLVHNNARPHIARPPHQPPVILSGTPELGWAPLTCGCWQINSILASIGHGNSIRILNQYPFWWNISIRS